ncbi:MAG: hypothetical protein K8R90_07540 [Candidatus Cloacimonetes bacterium]|nr:hypothetical protein [Candidatus Cloacimonadota bacterium]
MRLAWLCVIVVALLLTTGCRSATESKDEAVRFLLEDTQYIYDDSLLVQLGVGADLNATHATFYLDEALVATDWEAPFEWMWQVQECELGQHAIDAHIYTEEGSVVNADTWLPKHTPVPFFDFYLQNWDGITARDENGNLTGEVDPRDWLLHSFDAPGERDAWVFNLWVSSYDREVTVHWSTMYEADNQGFHVWRGESVDAIDTGQAIRLTANHIIPGAGDSQEQQNYTWFDDFRVEYCTYFYWVEAIDNEGAGEMFGPVEHSVSPWSEDLEDQLFPAWPNPAVDLVHLGFELTTSDLDVTVMTVNQQGDILDVLLLGEPLTYGRHSLLWNSSAYTHQLLRVLYYFAGGDSQPDIQFWGYGDVYVQ